MNDEKQNLHQPHFDRELDLSVDETRRAIGAAADIWGAVWTSGNRGGRLLLPVTHGLRQSILDGEVSIDKDPYRSGATARFRIDSTTSRLNWPATLVLGFGAMGGVVAMLWPFYPRLLFLAPAGIVLAIAGWLLVASRLRTTDVGDFFDLVADIDPADDEAGI